MVSKYNKEFWDALREEERVAKQKMDETLKELRESRKNRMS